MFFFQNTSCIRKPQVILREGRGGVGEGGGGGLQIQMASKGSKE